MMSIDGVHLERDLGLHLLADSEETIIPQVRQDSIEIPGRHGEIVFDSYLESRRLFPTVLIPSQATLTDVQNILRRVSSLLLDKYGRPKNVKVIYDYEPEKYYICRMNGYLSPERVAKTGKFLIPLYANDPFAYAEMLAYEPESKTYDTGHVYNVGDLYPNPVKVDWRFTTQYSSIYNHSLFATPLLINIEGSVEDMRIHNMTNGQAIMFDGLQSGLINIGDLTVTKDGANLMTKMRGDFVYLDPGENMIELHGYNPKATVTYKWKHRFV